jgi:DNA-binding transcriptional ArsR family regulator
MDCMTAAIRTEDIEIPAVLSALGHPARLQIVRMLADVQERRCGGIIAGVSKSTLTHHWKVLRDAGVISQRPSGRENLLSLRREDLEARFPGLLDSVLAGTDGSDQVEAFLAQPE